MTQFAAFLDMLLLSAKIAHKFYISGNVSP
jgi:hypothetical protein